MNADSDFDLRGALVLPLERVSLERPVQQNKEHYYECLNRSSQR